MRGSSVEESKGDPQGSPIFVSETLTLSRERAISDAYLLSGD